MKTVTCDCCGADFEYGGVTAKTDGMYHTVKLGVFDVRVSLSVKSYDPVRNDHIDICPACRLRAIEEYLGEPVSGH